MGWPVPRLRRLINRGEGPQFVKVGRSITFREASIDMWLAKCERESVKILNCNRETQKSGAAVTKTGAQEKTGECR